MVEHLQYNPRENSVHHIYQQIVEVSDVHKKVHALHNFLFFAET